MRDSPQLNPQDRVIIPAFAPRRVTFTYKGTISDAGIKALCEQIDLAIDLYQPMHLVVQLDSPGGSALALDYWIYRLKQWRKIGIEIETMADTVCASAAALALTFGVIGRRFAHPLTKLHFHNPRVHTSGPTEVQEHLAEDFARVLKDSRSRMHALLKEHLIGGLGKTGFIRTLKARAQWLLCESHSLSSADSQRIGYEAALLADAATAIEAWSQQPAQDSDCTDSAISEWEQRVAEMFNRDRPVDLRYAWALLLIDGSEQLPPLIEHTPPSDDEEDDHRLPSTTPPLVSPSYTQ